MNLKSLTLSALIAGSTMVALPALACDGHKDDTTAAAATKAEPAKAMTLVGMVTKEGCPMEAGSMDCTGCVLTLESGPNGGKYMIMKDATAEKMIKKLFGKKNGTARIEVKGEVIEKDGKKMVRVKSYKRIALA